jgi:hypothetical protein
MGAFVLKVAFPKSFHFFRRFLPDFTEICPVRHVIRTGQTGAVAQFETDPSPDHVLPNYNAKYSPFASVSDID